MDGKKHVEQHGILQVLRQHRPPLKASSSRITMNGLLDLDSDVAHHQNVISWSLGHTPALRKISSKSVGNLIIQ